MDRNEFVAQSDHADTTLKNKTVGLVHHVDFKRIREAISKDSKSNLGGQDEKTKKFKDEKLKAKEKQKRNAILSFAGEEDEDDEQNNQLDIKSNSKDTLKRVISENVSEEDEEEDFLQTFTTLKSKKKKLNSESIYSTNSKKSLKNPNVRTDFLPDKEREIELDKEKQKLKRLWTKEQEKIKQEQISITYSFWDGSGHRSTVQVSKGDSIAKFLEICCHQWPQLRNTNADNLMYVKEDLIIPHYYTFYDFIVNKTRGKSGPLFNFDVHDDIRLLNDATVESDDSHAGKVIQKNWYDKNKHIFPYNRYEIFDPQKDYGKYSIKDSRKS